MKALAARTRDIREMTNKKKVETGMDGSIRPIWI
jgi:hypothetical protein